MAGNETKGFDLVMEFSEEALRKYLSAIFDQNGLLCQLLDQLNVGFFCGAFQLEVSLDRPADVTIPPSASDILDVRIQLGDDGSLGTLRFVAGVGVDRTQPEFDLPFIDLEDKLFHAEASIPEIPIPIPPSLFEEALSSLGRIPLIPMLVDRDSGDPVGLPTRLDTRVIDDDSPSDLDAWALMLTFGGGVPGDGSALQRSFVPDGSDNAIAFSFDWFCRVISPAVDEALGLDGAFTDCRLNRSVRIADDPDVDLTRFELRLREGFIEVVAKVRNKGTCYSVTGTVSAGIKLEVENGELVVETEVGDPDFEVDIPWYCWVAGAAILALLGGAIAGVMGALIGGVIIPLIVWFSKEFLEGKVQEGLKKVTDFLNQFAPDVRVEAVGFNLVFQDAFIDDIAIVSRMEIVDTVPIRSEGTVSIRNGQYVDLDSGKVGDDTLPSPDLEWRGSSAAAFLRTTCTSALARTGRRSFDGLNRAELYTFEYASPVLVPFLEIASIDPVGVLTGDLFKETRRVFAVRTNEGRYAVVQVVAVRLSSIQLRYRTYEKFLPTVEIHGDFRCLRPPVVAGVSDVVFEPSTAGLDDAGAGGGENTLAPQPADYTDRIRERCGAAARADLARVPRDLVEKAFYDDRGLDKRRIGAWKARYQYPAGDVGRFNAITNGLHAPLTYLWELDGVPLEEATSAEVSVQGEVIRYALSGNRLQLSQLPQRALELELKVSATDDNGVTVGTNRCLHYAPVCEETGRFIPNWPTYRSAHLEHFGIVELPAETR